MKKLFIKKLKINLFRSLKNIDIDFNENFNLIEAKNGLGKSSILDAIRYILFRKNAFCKTADNFKSIPNDEFPDIELILSFNEKSINLKTANNKWFIEDIEYKNFKEYEKAFLKKLDIEGSERLFQLINPFTLLDLIASSNNESKDKKELKNQIISTMNEGLDYENKIHNFDDLNQKKKDLEDQKSKIEKDIKEKEKEIKFYKEQFPEITNWDIEIKDETKTLLEINEKINNYIKIKNDIKSLQDKIDKNNIQIKNINFETNNPNYKKDISRKLYIFLCIITFGIYYFITKKRKANNNNNVSDKQYRIKQLEKENIETQNKIDSLQNNHYYKDVDYENLLSQKLEIEIANNNNTDNEIKKKRFKEMNDYLNGLKQNQEQILLNYNQIFEKYTEISKKIENFINDNFKNFSIEFSNESSDDKLIISQNSVKINYLNFANKFNIFLEINHFLKNQLKIDNFVLIDQCESFNNLYTENKNSQTIACKVTNDEVIKVNGKPLH